LLSRGFRGITDNNFGHSKTQTAVINMVLVPSP